MPSITFAASIAGNQLVHDIDHGIEALVGELELPLAGPFFSPERFPFAPAGPQDWTLGGVQGVFASIEEKVPLNFEAPGQFKTVQVTGRRDEITPIST